MYMESHDLEAKLYDAGLNLMVGSVNTAEKRLAAVFAANDAYKRLMRARQMAERELWRATEVEEDCRGKRRSDARCSSSQG
jgi:hypothetical protein